MKLNSFNTQLMKIKATVLILLFSLTICLAQNSPHTFLSVLAGGKYVTQMSSFEENLALQNHSELNKLGYTYNFGMGVRTNRLFMSISFHGTLLKNKPSENKANISFYEFSMLSDFSYNLVQKENIMLAPVLGVGVGNSNLVVAAPDTTYSLNQILSGSKNEFVGETKLNWSVKMGIRVGFPNAQGKERNAYPEIQLGYYQYLNKFKWNIADMPVTRLNGFYAQIGWIWWLRYN